MRQSNSGRNGASSRRAFMRGSVATLAVPLFASSQPALTGAEQQAEKENPLAFTPHGAEYRFETGTLRGALRSQGRSRGLIPVVEAKSGKSITRSAGLFSHYRLLDASNRFGTAGWDWSSQSQLLPSGVVETTWKADQEHPFDMKATYRWATPRTLDVTTSVVPRADLPRFEVFLASYFEGFAASFVYVQDEPKTGEKGSFFEAKKSHAVWQMFPRDDESVQIIGDGRWQRPPNPVAWRIMPQLAAPLAMRRDAATGLAGLVMAPAEDCFAVATPYSEENHRSLYLSLFGRDLRAGQKAVARARLVIDRGISDAQAIALYEAYLQELRKEERA